MHRPRVLRDCLDEMRKTNESVCLAKLLVITCYLGKCVTLEEEMLLGKVKTLEFYHKILILSFWGAFFVSISDAQDAKGMAGDIQT